MVSKKSPAAVCLPMLRRISKDTKSHSQISSSFEKPNSFNKPLKYDIGLNYKIIDKEKYNVLTSEASNIQDVKAQIDTIIHEYEYAKFMTGQVPSDLSVEAMRDLLKSRHAMDRSKLIRHFFLKEVRKMRDRAKRAENSARFLEMKATREPRQMGIWDEDGKLDYRLWGNCLISRINRNNISHHQMEKKQRHAALFGQRLIIDLDYDEHMTLQEARINARHIAETLAKNIKSADPYNIVFTNVDYTKPTMEGLKKYFHFGPFTHMAFNEHFLSQSSVEAFDRDRLVYLSPNAPTNMKEYNHDDIYIIGGFLDKSSRAPVSNIKAQQTGIRQYRLPIEEYVAWGSGASKSFCMMHMVAILNALKDGVDWKTAFRENIPQRKLKTETEVEDQIEFYRRKMNVKKFKLFTEKSK